MAAKLILYSKETLRKRYVLELKVYRVDDLKRFPDSIKYSLIDFDLQTEDKVLMDNHHPKGHHLHPGDKEFPYIY